MLLVGYKNVSAQSIEALGLIDFGSVYRKYCNKNACGMPAFTDTGDTVSLNHKGIYHITAVITYTVPTAGAVEFQLLENGIVIPGATTAVTAATDTAYTSVLDYYVIVSCVSAINTITTGIKSISIQNTGVAVDISNVVLNITKEV
jgi:hypothetical protein